MSQVGAGSSYLPPTCVKPGRVTAPYETGLSKISDIPKQEDTMMTIRWHSLLASLVLGLALVLVALLALWSGAALPARAAGPTCMICLDGTCTYTTLQAAVDDPGCTEIKVAQGVYTGVQARPVPAGYPHPPASGLITQVVYINRPVTMRGGYTTTN
jgi:hypothetical protein